MGNTSNILSNANTVVPGLQTIVKPSLLKVLMTLQRSIFKNLNAVKVGVVQSFDPILQQATIQIAFQQVQAISPTGVRTIKEYPTLVNVPCVFQQGGGFVLTMPIAKGDEALLLFNDRELDNFIINGPGSAPSSGRAHDLSDAIAIIGLRDNTRPLENFSMNGAQLRTVDGTTFLEVNATGVRVHGAKVYEWDVQGYGQKITWTGGPNYTIDNYTTGAVITTNTHPISPPGPP